MNNRINKIIVLENDQKYIVVNQAVYKNESYLLLNKVSDDEKEIETDILIVKEINDEDGSIHVELVTDPKLLDLRAKYLPPQE